MIKESINTFIEGIYEIINPKLKVDTEIVTRVIYNSSTPVIKCRDFKVWYGGINPRVEEYRVVTSYPDDLHLNNFDFDTFYHSGLLLGKNFTIERDYEKSTKFL